MPTPLSVCPACGASVTPSDRFCENCGASLIETDSPSTDPVSTAVTLIPGCARCGADPDQIDSDGFCANCGFRNRTTNGPIVLTLSDQLAGISDRGRRHAVNEDALALEVWEDCQLLVVCDGVSSSQTPELASAIAAGAIAQFLQTRIAEFSDTQTALREAIQFSNHEVGRLPFFPQKSYDAPSTTAVAALVRGNQVTVGWVGDSRAYWIPLYPAQGVGVQLTRDHAWAAEMVATGQLSAAEAARSPKAHAITRWIGADAGEDCGPEVATYALTGPGYLLLSSDGLWNYAPNPGELAALIQAAGNLSRRTRATQRLGLKPVWRPSPQPRSPNTWSIMPMPVAAAIISPLPS